MITVGVDLASQDKETGLARIRWEPGHAVVEVAVVDVGDEEILEEVRNSDKAGIDCPFGWPREFVALVNQHHEGRPHPSAAPYEGRKGSFAYRATDHAVRELPGQRMPLSVSTNWIAYPALRCALLLSKLEERLGHPVDRGGSGLVVEVYPAASMRAWSVTTGKYKKKQNLAGLGALMDTLHKLAGWLHFDDEYERLCRTKDDAFDAVIAALTARAAERDHVTQPNRDQQELARREGWIAVPTCELDDLVAG